MPRAVRGRCRWESRVCVGTAGCAACRLVFVCGWLGQAHYVVCHARVWHSKWRDVTVAAVPGRRFAEFDKAWEVVVLGIIGQCFGSNNTINGARFVDKSSRGTPMCRLEVWMSSEDFGDDVAAATKKAIELETQPKGGAQPTRGAYGSGGLSPSWQKKRHNGSRY